jgi:hypothetical protein
MESGGNTIAASFLMSPSSGITTCVAPLGRRWCSSIATRPSLVERTCDSSVYSPRRDFEVEAQLHAWIISVAATEAS